MLTKEFLLFFLAAGSIATVSMGILIDHYNDITKTTIGMDAIASADISHQFVVFDYTVLNTGATPLDTVNVTANCCSGTLGTISNVPPYTSMNGQNYTNASGLGLSSGDAVLITFSGKDDEGNTKIVTKRVILH